MFETTRYESGRQLRGTAVASLGLAILTVFFVWYYSVLDPASLMQTVGSLPPAMREAFGIKTIATIGGFLSTEVYNFLWILGLGLYFAYVAGGLIAGDVERDRMDLLLSFPISRSQLLFEKFSALLLPMLAFNVVVALVVYGGSVVIGDSLDPMRLAMVHLLSIPYLLTCASIGTVFTVVFDRADLAKRSAIGAVFVLFLLKSVTAGVAGYEWIQHLSPMHYYDPTAILIEGTYNLANAGLLLVVSVVLLIGSQLLFQRRDI